MFTKLCLFFNIFIVLGFDVVFHQMPITIIYSIFFIFLISFSKASSNIRVLLVFFCLLGKFCELIKSLFFFWNQISEFLFNNSENVFYWIRVRWVLKFGYHYTIHRQSFCVIVNSRLKTIISLSWFSWLFESCVFSSKFRWESDISKNNW